ncbi:D-Ala-D-Ala carboxypeptidase family metallohydrolase [Akkermansiaceae bacterium]|nr:D-Ala-D-Ala carboxypeptidase family metallohydrolase [Akkermansiaceae bacterium]MDA7888727.1 D-Ala-D-Ala carboxypeptidase family metallohydrolase [Akkermansiaceae bacterium]MDB4537540.1 D-Ala-D-Ala carboxypeptidase family metallohydrolase [Akkermansiaceae bacterium]
MPKPTTTSSIVLPTRRNFLAATTAAAAGLACTVQTSQAFLFRRSKPFDMSGLPSSWVAKQGERNIQSYADYLTGLRLKNVTPMQVIEAHAKKKGSVWNSLPPRSMWRDMGGSLKVADRIAAEVGTPVKEVTSAYRSPEYNRRCPGAKSRSWHTKNFALDLKFGTSTSRVAGAARYLRSKGVFKGGVGRYSSFTHVDTRGQNVDW